ncbi:hypothetical protein N0V91_009113 [Didymella pomorum]|jgi:hypothetical protein|uniref:Uncharacterized protein n=1 Tax=Didymella pomorum TaxID=749634 RepID=A0A9W9D3B2_9PLEO|nr:hypothetical protein N0V91_009113 [Didymella pomorum]
MRDTQKYIVQVLEPMKSNTSDAAVFCPAHLLLDVDQPYMRMKHHNNSFMVDLLAMIRLARCVSYLRVDFHASSPFTKAVADLSNSIVPDGDLTMYDEHAGAGVIEGVYLRMLISQINPSQIRLGELKILSTAS